MFFFALVESAIVVIICSFCQLAQPQIDFFCFLSRGMNKKKTQSGGGRGRGRERENMPYVRKMG